MVEHPVACPTYCGLVHAHAANLQDRLGAQSLVARTAASDLPRLELVWGGGAYAGAFARWLGAERGWHLEGRR
jgi:hypothetical protein